MKSKQPYWLELCFKRPLHSEMVHISSYEDASKFVKNEIQNGFINHKEYFWIIVLTRSHHILGMKEISSGTTQQTIVSIKELVQVAVLANSCSCILVHNHPSGNLKPSQCDIKLTNKAQEVFKLIDIELLDHLIITQEDCFSFAENGLISGA